MRTRSLSIFLCSCLLAALVTGCSNDEIKVSDEQEILFEVNYVNYAWGYQNRGYLIDKMGRIRRYENPKDWKFASPGPLTAAEMDENLSKTTFATYTIPLAELEQYVNVLKKVSDGDFTDPVNKMADAGATSYYVYHFDPGTKTYRTVLLQSVGDTDVFNRDPDAKRIADWLVTVSQKLN